MGRTSYYDEVEIEDFAWDEDKRVYHYPCPCGDRFEITKKQLAAAEDVATCPSCSLLVRVIYDYMDFEHCADDEDDEPPSQAKTEESTPTVPEIPRPDAALQPLVGVA